MLLRIVATLGCEGPSALRAISSACNPRFMVYCLGLGGWGFGFGSPRVWGPEVVILKRHQDEVKGLGLMIKEDLRVKTRCLRAASSAASRSAAASSLYELIDI
jgi:hypothetical protein